jgi:formylglycine-generating enzyme required for sulfatase activity
VIRSGVPAAGKILPVGTSTDQTPDTRIYDLAGNVSEWTGTPNIWDEAKGDYLKPEPGLANGEALKYWTAGASHEQAYSDFSIADSRRRGFQGPQLGFRCALSLNKYLLSPSTYQTQ